MLNKLLQSLYNKVFVNIVVKGTKSTVYMELCSGNKKLKMLDNAQATFDTSALNEPMLNFIDSFTRESPYFYISILDTSLDQGALAGCEKVSHSESKCFNNQWTFYTSKADLYAIEKKYQKIGVDFVFSSFSVLSNFFKDKTDSSIAMYVLIETTALSVAVFLNGRLLFGEYVDMHNIVEEYGLGSSGLGDDLLLELDDGIDLEDIDVDEDEMELIDDFGDIEDLDSIEEIDEFSEHEEIIKDAYTSSTDISANQDSFNDDYQRFSLIQSSMESYYNDAKYESQFIEQIYIADGVGVSPELKRYLEEEMFLSVYVRHIDVAIEVCELAKMEFNA